MAGIRVEVGAHPVAQVDADVYTYSRKLPMSTGPDYNGFDPEERALFPLPVQGAVPGGGPTAGGIITANFKLPLVWS
jgi:hypothetical protein